MPSSQHARHLPLALQESDSWVIYAHVFRWLGGEGLCEVTLTASSTDPRQAQHEYQVSLSTAGCRVSPLLLSHFLMLHPGYMGMTVVLTGFCIPGYLHGTSTPSCSFASAVSIPPSLMCALCISMLAWNTAKCLHISYIYILQGTSSAHD